MWLAVWASGCSLLVPGSGGYVESRTDAGPDGGPPPLPDGGSCPGTLTLCDGACYDLTSDEAHCGRCEVACGTGEECRASVCVDPVVDLSVGPSHSCVVRGSGQVWCWGNNVEGQLGDGTVIPSNVPVRVQGIDEAIRVSAGGMTFRDPLGSTCAVRRNGEVRCWGSNYSGQLGDGTTMRSLMPLVVPGLPPIATVHSGFAFACGVSTTQRPYCWGTLVPTGTLGRAAEVVAPGVSGPWVEFLDASCHHACAVTAAATVMCFGDNNAGEVGADPTTLPETAQFRLVSGVDGALDVAAGPVSSCATLTNGEVWCWGAESALGIGSSTATPHPTPARVSGISDAVAVETGPFAPTNCAIRGARRTLSCWGRNLMDPAMGSTSSPIDVAGLAGVQRVALGATHACALLEGGLVRCWGDNTNGLLGDGTSDPRWTPGPVTGLP
ncbi:MAG: hypothetical protein IT378_03810 [Sandaracinaceae bacterium]|nr:hypothetical protein [Sandaracinaceae bacterium]